MNTTIFSVWPDLHHQYYLYDGAGICLPLCVRISAWHPDYQTSGDLAFVEPCIPFPCYCSEYHASGGSLLSVLFIIWQWFYVKRQVWRTTRIWFKTWQNGLQIQQLRKWHMLNQKIKRLEFCSFVQNISILQFTYYSLFVTLYTIYSYLFNTNHL